MNIPNRKFFKSVHKFLSAHFRKKNNDFRDFREIFICNFLLLPLAVKGVSMMAAIFNEGTKQVSSCTG